MPTNRQRGFRAERELVRKLWNYGFAVIRAPASGAGTRNIFYPDIIAIYHGKVFVIEVKYRSSSEAIYISKDKMEKLMDFAKRANAQVLIAIKIKNKGWYLVTLQDSCIAISQGCKIAINDSNAIALESFVKKVVNNSLESYINDSIRNT